jgi:hypothetical protein
MEVGEDGGVIVNASHGVFWFLDCGITTVAVLFKEKIKTQTVLNFTARAVEDFCFELKRK